MQISYWEPFWYTIQGASEGPTKGSVGDHMQLDPEVFKKMIQRLFWRPSKPQKTEEHSELLCKTNQSYSETLARAAQQYRSQLIGWSPSASLEDHTNSLEDYLDLL